MTGLRAPGLGPIVGHTTDKSCKIWIRADDPADEGANLDSDRRTIGVASIVAKDGKPIPATKRRAHYFRLRREYDRTGTFEFGVDSCLTGTPQSEPLAPDSEYTFRMGTLTIDDPRRNDENVLDGDIAKLLPDPAVWIEALDGLEEKRSLAVARTYPQKSNKLSFIVGSCRYPGVLFQIKNSDKIFAPLLSVARQAHESGPAQFTLMVGDQIYADKFNRLLPVGRAESFAEFQSRYAAAFGSGNMRKLLRNIPNYMILDDHEIEDNWSYDRLVGKDARRALGPDAKALIMNAVGAHRSDQWHHGPRNFGDNLFYSFDCGGFPVFVLDTRTMRRMNEQPGLADNHMLGRPAPNDDVPGQLEYFLHWLGRMQDERGNVPKIVATPSVFVPNPMSARQGASDDAMEESDSWPAFPETRRAILKTIVAKKIQNVVFVSGDIHCSNVAEISFSGAAKSLKAFAVTSSALYWPWAFADGAPSDYVHYSRSDSQRDTFQIGDPAGTTMDYVASNFTQEDNFCRIDIDKKTKTMVVRAFNDEGKVISNSRLDRSMYSLETRFELAPW